MAKTKIETTYAAKYVPLVLWWDDVTEIFEILQADAKAVELETSQYKFTTLDVAKEHFGDTPQYDVKISASSPYVRISEGSLHVGAGPSSAKVFLEIDKLLKKRERRPKWTYKSWLIIPVIFLGFATFATTGEFVRAGLLGLQVAFCAIYVRAAYLSMKRGMAVYPRRASEKRGFLQRNRDQLLMYVITAIVSGVLGFAGAQLKDRLFPPVTAPQK